MLHLPKLNSGINSINGQWEKLCRKIQAYIEHHPLTNSNAGALSRGQIVYASGNRTMDLAQADAEATSRWIAVVSEPTAIGGQGVATTGNIERVLFENGQNPVAGQPVFLSATLAGAGRNTAPAAGWSIRVGIIIDASMYVSGVNPYCDVLLGRCCAPQEIQI